MSPTVGGQATGGDREKQTPMERPADAANDLEVPEHARTKQNAVQIDVALDGDSKVPKCVVDEPIRAFAEAELQCGRVAGQATVAETPAGQASAESDSVGIVAEAGIAKLARNLCREGPAPPKARRPGAPLPSEADPDQPSNAEGGSIEPDHGSRVPEAQ